jgi:hypothetical protein
LTPSPVIATLHVKWTWLLCKLDYCMKRGKRSINCHNQLHGNWINFIYHKATEAQWRLYQQVEFVHKFRSLPLHSVIARLQWGSFYEKVPLCIIQ